MGALTSLENTTWRGRAELWLDPLGNEVDTCDCSLDIVGEELRYLWSYEGKTHVGTLALRPGGAEFTDTFHSARPMACLAAPSPWGLVDVLGRYSAGDGPDWGWRIGVALRPSGELVLAMTNVAPWGEEGRAVRMIFTRA